MSDTSVLSDAGFAAVAPFSAGRPVAHNGRGSDVRRGGREDPAHCTPGALYATRSASTGNLGAPYASHGAYEHARLAAGRVLPDGAFPPGITHLAIDGTTGARTFALAACRTHSEAAYLCVPGAVENSELERVGVKAETVVFVPTLSALNPHLPELIRSARLIVIDDARTLRDREEPSDRNRAFRDFKEVLYRMRHVMARRGMSLVIVTPERHLHGEGRHAPPYALAGTLQPLTRLRVRVSARTDRPWWYEEDDRKRQVLPPLYGWRRPETRDWWDYPREYVRVVAERPDETGTPLRAQYAVWYDDSDPTPYQEVAYAL